ncbi:hypothetical protein ACHAWF_007652 [Thalassiosira exigua]
MKEDVASPTVSNEAVFITATIEAKEEQEQEIMCMLDLLPGACLCTYETDNILILSRADGPNQARALPKNVTYTSNGVPILHVLMNKAMYGVLNSALRLYMNLVKCLKAYGFKL